MAWSNSKVFGALLEDVLEGTTDVDLNSGTPTAALYVTGITPDETVTAALSAYDAATSQWLTANEVYQAGQWAQGGVAITTPSVARSGATGSHVVTFDDNGSDTASGSAFTTPSDAYGALVYDGAAATPVADQGICYNYFGGTPASVTNGTLTVQWNANGIFRITL